MKFFAIFAFAAFLVLVAEARLPKQLQERWGFMDTEEFNRGAQRIVKGQKADVGEAPFQISLQKDYLILKSHICGGSLISGKTIVTAAHCTDGQKPSSLIIRCETNKSNKPGPQKDFKTQRVIQHAGYNSETIENDISLIILQNAVNPSNNVKAISYKGSEVTDHQDVTVYGWGLTEGGSQQIPEDLQRGFLKTIPSSECNEKWGSVNPITKGMLCAFDRNGATSATTACNGDSGGPLVKEVEGEKILVGVVSWGENGCKASMPHVYTRVSEYVKWIDENIVN